MINDNNNNKSFEDDFFVFLEICCFKKYIFWSFYHAICILFDTLSMAYYLSFSNVFFSAFSIAYNFFMALKAHTFAWHYVL